MDRDRHGRGPRRPLLPATLPGARTRRERFDDAVATRVAMLESVWGAQWGRVDFAIEDVPPSDPSRWEQGVALARLFPASQDQGARIVVYRRPIEARCHDAADVAALVRDVLAENVGQIVGREAGDVDPDYGT